jgi:ABC-2 type transport system permease protein
MSRRANQVKAVITIARYSLLATLRSPTSIVFSLLFPMIFITVFGSINPSKPPILKLAIAQGSDTTSVVFKAIKAIPTVNLLHNVSAAKQAEDLSKGRLDAVINITADTTPARLPHYTVHIKASGSLSSGLDMLKTNIHEAIRNIDVKAFPTNLSVATLDVVKAPGRVYRNIDFILPGQLGFSLLMAGVYGSSFLLFSLRKDLVLKRLRATPVKRRSIIAGEMISRLFFHIISFIIMVVIGYYAFDFTLINGVATVAEMLVYSLFGLGIFMGIGFIISGVVQSENSITPISNTIVLPQILLCGLFFPTSNYPHWLQAICDKLPLSLFVDGLRKIAFEGTHIWQLPLITVGGLVLWNFVIIPVAVRSFRWE